MGAPGSKLDLSLAIVYCTSLFQNMVPWGTSEEAGLCLSIWQPLPVHELLLIQLNGMLKYVPESILDEK